MKFLAVIRQRIKGITDAFERYPLTIVFLIATAVLISLEIQTHNDTLKYQLACAIGAFASIVLQAAFERFFVKAPLRLAFMGASVLIAGVYYLLIRPAPKIGAEISIKTMVTMFALVMAYIYIPSAKSRISFNQSFMVVFKAFFQAIFFAGVLFAGCAIILGAVDTLIVELDPDWYGHTANIVFVLFAPIFFLSWIPLFPGKWEQGENRDIVEEKNKAVERAAHSPKFLDILVSYIVIPLAAAFTVILAIYILINIGGQFWTNNLLEPMLVSYAVGVILLSVLLGNMQQRMAKMFRSIFPKVLIPIVLFQIAASILKMGDTGLTHTRYYVILFGLFAAVSGVLLSFSPIRKTGLVALILIVFSVASIVPPVDAFTLSRNSQMHRLASVLTENGMIQDGQVVPNASLSDRDKEIIATSVDYLYSMGYTERVEYLPAGFESYRDFYDTFGFYAFDTPRDINRPVYVSLDETAPLHIQGYDVLIRTRIEWADGKDQMDGPTISDISYNGKGYTLIKQDSQDGYAIVLLDGNQTELIRLNTAQILAWLDTQAVDNADIPQEEATFLADGETARMAVIVTNANMDRSGDTAYYYLDLAILIDF